jgi:predicted transposase YbfD/YdcC
VTKLEQLQLEELFSKFQNVADPRVLGRCSHSLYSVVVIAVCASIADCTSWHDMARFAKEKQQFFEKFLDLPNGVPSHDTFTRVFRLLDTPQFLEVIRGWITMFAEKIQQRSERERVVSESDADGASAPAATARPHIALDGKTLRGSRRATDDCRALQLVNAWSVDNKLVLGQLAVDPNSNEITAIPLLIDALDLKGTVVTLDAAHCQHATVRKIVDKEADFIVSVKGNQEKLHAQTMEAFEQQAEQNFEAAGTHRHVTTTVEAGDHPKEIVREYTVMPVPAEIKEQWPDAKSIGMVVTRHINSETREETGGVRYYLSSLSARVKRFVKYTRDHWCVENELHWRLDVTFGEDRSSIHKGNGAINASVLRRISLSILKQDTSIKDNVHGKRKRASFSEQALTAVLTGVFQ